MANPTMTPDELRAAMARFGFKTRDDLAAFLQVSVSTVRDWLGGRSPIPYPVSLLLWTMRWAEYTTENVDHIAQSRG